MPPLAWRTQMLNWVSEYAWMLPRSERTGAPSSPV